ncbi:MAG: aldo/keto reductase, partial [Candidatus Desulfacyla sp.]
MEHRRLGRSELMVSAVGFGTCQLRLTMQAQAMDTLLKGFELGVNLVHTAPDYGNAEELVARAVQQSGRHIMVASQGYDVPGNATGPVSHFEKLFETTCKLLGAEQLDLYGIACIDDREVHQENVWGKNGMVDFLLKKKEEGRLRGIFCTTHGAPEYVRQLVTSGVFDAVMLAYNILGYHLLTCHPPPDRHYESLPRNEKEIFPLCHEHDVGLMIMKPLGGGLLCESKAFPPHRHGKGVLKGTRAADILRSVLLHPEVSCVLPGTASVAEAEENAVAGYAPIDLDRDRQTGLTAAAAGLRRTVCSRCGACDSLCSQGLTISSLFWAGLMHQYPSAVFEQPEGIEYFRLHPQLDPICGGCPNPTCACPDGINIPQNLKELHLQMVDLMRQGLIRPPETEKGRLCGDVSFGARIVSMDIPKIMAPGKTYLCRLLIENAGERGWHASSKVHQARVMLGVFVEGERIQTIEVTQDVRKGGRWHFVFEVTAPQGVNRFRLRLHLLGEHQGFSETLGPMLLSKKIPVRGAPPEKALGRGKMGLAAGRYWEERIPLGSHLLRKAATEMFQWCTVCRTRSSSLIRLLKGRRQANPEEAMNSRLDPKLRRRLGDETVSSYPYDVAWLENNLPASFPKGEPFQVYLHVENRGSRHWHAVHPEGKWVE